jgi:tetratricopeptide (TPR) repeat protein
MPTDWFRTTDWGGTYTEDFEARLARSAKHNRPQYLKIKAIALDAAGQSASAIALLQRVIDEYPDSLDCAQAHELRGDIFRRGGDLVAAEDSYRMALQRRPDLNATSGVVPLSLAEVLFERHGGAAAIEVRKLLAYPAMQIVFNVHQVRALTLSARLADSQGDTDLRRSEAARALEAASAPSQFSRHPGIGVADLTAADLEELERLASSTPSPPSKRGLWRRR